MHVETKYVLYRRVCATMSLDLNEKPHPTLSIPSIQPSSSAAAASSPYWLGHVIVWHRPKPYATSEYRRTRFSSCVKALVNSHTALRSIPASYKRLIETTDGQTRCSGCSCSAFHDVKENVLFTNTAFFPFIAQFSILNIHFANFSTCSTTPSIFLLFDTMTAHT